MCLPSVRNKLENDLLLSVGALSRWTSAKRHHNSRPTCPGDCLSRTSLLTPALSCLHSHVRPMRV